MKLAVQYTRDEINAKIPYAVIVENWDKRLNGRVKRMYEEAFTVKERMSIGAYYKRFYSWYLIKGVPENCTFIIRNVELLKRAGHFFASI